MKLNIGKIANLALKYVVMPAIANAVAKNRIEPSLPPKETVNVVKDQIGKAILDEVLKRV